MNQWVDAEVPLPTSPLSSSKTFNPRSAASLAMPAPLIPAPIMIRSNVAEVWSVMTQRLSVNDKGYDSRNYTKRTEFLV